jgi:glycosyltransferase involved in cell wall biosynthesis
MANRISVVICTWNRADLLDQTLHSLAQVSVPVGLDWELLVVDNRSPDHTSAVLERHTRAGHLPLRPLYEAQQGVAHARNLALAHANGDWLVWTDDDVRFAPGWLNAIKSACAEYPQASAFGGVVAPWFPVAPDPDLLAAFPSLANGFCGTNHGPTARPLTDDEHLFTVNMACRRSAIGAERFNTTLGRIGSKQGGGVDTEFLARIRPAGPVWWIPDMRVEHYVEPQRMTLDYARRFCAEAYHIHDPHADPAPRWAGVPRWLFKQYVTARLAAVGHWWLGQRRQHLVQLLLAWRSAGMIRAYRAVG